MSPVEATTDPTRPAAQVPAPVLPDVVELERALTRIAHLLTRARRHGQTTTEAGVDVDRAAASVLRLLADEPEPLRLGELAGRLAVEAPHVTRQVQRLERSGYLERIPDSADRRAHRVRLTLAGREIVDAIQAVDRRWMYEALAGWSADDLRQLAELNHRMVDDFLAHGERLAACDQGAAAPDRPGR